MKKKVSPLVTFAFITTQNSFLLSLVAYFLSARASSGESDGRKLIIYDNAPPYMIKEAAWLG